MAKYKVVREKYERYTNGGIITSTITAKTDEEALLICCDNYLYSYTDENDNELGDEGFIMPSKDELLAQIRSQNGDGADYIMLIQNMTTGKTLFETGDLHYEDDEEDEDDEDIDYEEDDDIDDDDGIRDYEVTFKVKGITVEELRWITKYALETLSKELDIPYHKFEDLTVEED